MRTYVIRKKHAASKPAERRKDNGISTYDDTNGSAHRGRLRNWGEVSGKLQYFFDTGSCCSRDRKGGNTGIRMERRDAG